MYLNEGLYKNIHINCGGVFWQRLSEHQSVIGLKCSILSKLNNLNILLVNTLKQLPLISFVKEEFTNCITNLSMRQGGTICNIIQTQSQYEVVIGHFHERYTLCSRSVRFSMNHRSYTKFTFNYNHPNFEKAIFVVHKETILL